MEKEIDLREYINVLLKHWKLVVAVTLVAAVTTAAAGFAQQRTRPVIYQASALVRVLDATYYVNPFLDSGLPYAWTGTGLTRGTRVKLGASPELEQRVAEALGDSLSPEERVPGVLSQMISLSIIEDSALIEVSAQAGDPEKAAKMANTWVEAYVELLDETYGDPLGGQAYFENRLQTAAEDLEAARKALGEFEQRTGLGVLGTEPLDLGPLGTELRAKLSSLARSQAIKVDIELMLEEIRGLKEESREPSAAQLSDLLFRFLRLSGAGEFGLRLEVSLDQIVTAVNLQDLISALEARDEALSKAITQMETDIAGLQEELVREKSEWGDLRNAVNLAFETYSQLARKLEGAKVMKASPIARVVSRAVAPNGPVPMASSQRRALANVAIATVLGLFVGIFGAFVVEYFSRSKVGG